MSYNPDPLVVHVKPASNFNYEKVLIKEHLRFYKTTSNNRGYVKIINVDDPTKRREGSEVDVANLQTLFTQMGFTVDIHDNAETPPTKDNIRQALDDFVQHDRLKTADMVILFIMSHGDNDNGRDFFLTLEDEKIYLEEVRAYFTNSHCKHMQGKPKLLFYQTCRGEVQDIGTIRVAQHDGNSINVTKMPKVSDLLTAYATTSDSVAFRWPGIGSLFIWWLCDEFMTHAHEHDVATMLGNIYSKMGEKEVLSETYGAIVQTGEFTQTQFERCYLNPGIYRKEDGKVGRFTSVPVPTKLPLCAKVPSLSLIEVCIDGDIQRMRDVISQFQNSRRKLNLDARSESSGWTVLHQAARKGHVEVCRELLDLHASVDVEDNKGKTPLHLAASHGHFDTVRLLVERKADIDRKDRSGKTPMDVANKHPDIAKFLATCR